MQVRYFREYSNCLHRFMEYKLYGHAGTLCMVIPTQDNRFYEWEDQGMFDQVQDLIDDGKVQFLCVDSIDSETWSNRQNATYDRMQLHERWMEYVIQECIPSAKKHTKTESSRLWVIGASLGATHATNLMLRFPDLFDGLLAMSGIYDVTMFLNGYQDDIVYLNNPLQYLPNMDVNHDYIHKYNEKQLIFCVGQGAWEDQTKADLHALQSIFNEKGIDAWFDYWGTDVYHDWPWWKVQLQYFMHEKF